MLDEVAVLIERFGCLTGDVFILNVRGHVLYLIGYAAGRLVDDAVRRFDEAEVVDAGIGCEIGKSQTDVREVQGSQSGTYGRNANSVRFAHFHGGTVTGQTAVTECRQAALMGQLCQRVILDP